MVNEGVSKATQIQLSVCVDTWAHPDFTKTPWRIHESETLRETHEFSTQQPSLRGLRPTATTSLFPKGQVPSMSVRFANSNTPNEHQGWAEGPALALVPDLWQADNRLCSGRGSQLASEVWAGGVTVRGPQASHAYSGLPTAEAQDIRP